MVKDNSLTADLGENLKNAVVHTLEKDLKSIGFSQINAKNFSNGISSSGIPVSTVPSMKGTSLRSSDIIPSKNASTFSQSSSPSYSPSPQNLIIKRIIPKEVAPKRITAEEISEKFPSMDLDSSLSPSQKIPSQAPIFNKSDYPQNYPQNYRTVVPNSTPSPFLNKIERSESNNISNNETEKIEKVEKTGGSAIEIEKQRSVPVHSEKKTEFPSMLEKYGIPRILPQIQKENKDFPNNVPIKNKEDNKLSVKKDGSLLIENIHSFGYILKRCFKIAFSIFLFSTIGFVSIYFWVTKASIESVLEQFIPQDFKAESVVPKREGEKLPNFSLDSANYLSFDINNLEKEGIKEVILKKSKEVLRSKASSPIEFSLTDKQNNPISFEFFSRKIGSPLLIEEMGNYIGSDFSLFMQNEEGNIKICLVVALKNNSDTELKSKLLSLEKRLLSEMNFIYLDYEKDFGNNEFNSSDYGDYGIRYINAVSEKKLSLDYAIYRNYLILGSSSLVERSVLDLMFQPKNEEKQQETGKTE